MELQNVLFNDLGRMDYKEAWDLQESLLQKNVSIKSGRYSQELRMGSRNPVVASQKGSEFEHNNVTANHKLQTTNYLLFVEHAPVYTLGKSGKPENILITEDEQQEKGIKFFHTNRGGDITFHGPGQVVGYPILDLEKFYTDIGRYLRDLEEVMIRTLAGYGIAAGRSAGETGVWIDSSVKGKERKICAMGIRCSRWITMHGFALNVNTDLGYFDHIIPCGIQNKKVTSLRAELGGEVDMEEVKQKLKQNFEAVFNVCLKKEAQNILAR